MNSKPKPTFKYSIANFVANGWLNIEYDDHPLYRVKDKSSLSAHAYKNKVHNWLILYLEGQKWSLSNMIGNLKELCTD